MISRREFTLGLLAFLGASGAKADSKQFETLDIGITGLFLDRNNQPFSMTNNTLVTANGQNREHIIQKINQTIEESSKAMKAVKKGQVFHHQESNETKPFDGVVITLSNHETGHKTQLVYDENTHGNAETFFNTALKEHLAGRKPEKSILRSTQPTP